MSPGDRECADPTTTAPVAGGSLNSSLDETQIEEELSKRWSTATAKLRRSRRRRSPGASSPEGNAQCSKSSTTTRRICDQAKVPRVCPHGLRGTHATLAESAGITSHVVAAALGHTSDQVTHRHYTEPDARVQAQEDRFMAALEGGKKPPTEVYERLGSQSSVN